MDKITNNFFHSQTNSTTELGHSPPFLDLSRKLLVNGFLIMIIYIYNQMFYLQECGDYSINRIDISTLFNIYFNLNIKRTG